MGQILGLGITHYPNLAAKLNMSWRFKKCLEDPTLPPDFRTPGKWHATAQEQWADDQGQAHSDSHRQDRQSFEVRPQIGALADSQEGPEHSLGSLQRERTALGHGSRGDDLGAVLFHAEFGSSSIKASENCCRFRQPCL